MTDCLGLPDYTTIRAAASSQLQLQPEVRRIRAVRLELLDRAANPACLPPAAGCRLRRAETADRQGACGGGGHISSAAALNKEPTLT